MIERQPCDGYVTRQMVEQIKLDSDLIEIGRFLTRTFEQETTGVFSIAELTIRLLREYRVLLEQCQPKTHGLTETMAKYQDLVKEGFLTKALVEHEESSQKTHGLTETMAKYQDMASVGFLTMAELRKEEAECCNADPPEKMLPVNSGCACGGPAGHLPGGILCRKP